MPSEPWSHHPQYHAMARAIEYLSDTHIEQPSLAEVASVAGMSDMHFQRCFSQWVGVSPKQFCQYLTKEVAKQRLQSDSVMASALEAGLSGPGRLHDLMLRWEAMTPGQYKQAAAGLSIRFGIGASPFGLCAMADTDRGLCELAFLDDIGEAEAFEAYLRERWSEAALIRDDAHVQQLAQKVFPEQPGKSAEPQTLRLLLKGSEFQLKVWEALLAIPEGQIVSYQQVAEYTGKPKAVRAVASAIARNAIGFLIPCHRVIRQNAEFSNYRWGPGRKRALIAYEAARLAASA